MESGRIDTPC